ncbi:MAG: tetratricopeptide repeat protein [Candidatus Kapabacteria bacterium]|nr:tetratricopeptide repeat protein [Candidatus Kapabacteria bacterium]
MLISVKSNIANFNNIQAKRLFLISFIFLFICNFHLFGQSAYDQMRTYVSESDYVKASEFIKQAIKDNPKDLNVHVLAGDIYFELEKYNEALDMYEKANDIKSKQTSILRKIGKTLSELERHQEAIKILKDAVSIDKNDFRNLLELGNAYIKSKQLNEAELTITKARELNRKSPEAFVALGDLYFAQNVYPLARTNYEEALAIDENLTEARVKLATTYYKLANQEIDRDLANELFTRSLKEWNIITQKDPKNAKALKEQGKILFFAKQYGEAAQSFFRYLDLRSDDVLIRWFYAQSLVEIGKCDSAVAQLQIVTQEIDSVRDKAKLKLAQCYFEQKRFLESAKTYEEVKNAIELDNVDIERLAVAYIRNGDTTKALSYYKELVNKDPSRCMLMYQTGILSFLIKDYNNALYFFDKHYKHCNDSLTPKTLYYIGNAYFNLSQTDSAIAYINLSLAKDPDYITSRIFLGDIYAAMSQNNGNKQFKENAKNEFRMAINRGMQDTARYARELLQAYAKLCGVFLEEKNFSELQKLAKQWTDYDGRSQFAWLYLAISYQGLSDKENACRSYRRVLQIDPKNATAKKNMELLQCQ